MDFVFLVVCVCVVSKPRSVTEREDAELSQIARQDEESDED